MTSRITVLMAVRDGERYLHEALMSLLGQTFQDFELLVVDDGSRDRSREIVLSFGDPRIRLLVQAENLGLATSLNRGLREARYELVARQDADDVSEPSRLERQVAWMEAHPGAALVGSAYTKMAAQGESLGERRLPADPVLIRWFLLFFCPFVHSAVMLRKPLAEEVGLYDERLRYAMDYDLWLRLADRYEVANLEEPLVRWRVHPSSMTSALEADPEGDGISRAAVCGMLGWDERDPERTARWRAMRAMMLRVPGASRRERVWAAGDLLRLGAAFRKRIGLGPAARWRHQAWLATLLGRRLMARGKG